MPLGLYISVPFCRTKCSYCNFASGVFSQAVFKRYVERVCTDIEHAQQNVSLLGACFDPEVDSIYLGGGTPTILDATQLEHLFLTVSQNFRLRAGAEITVECAPGTLTEPLIEALLGCGVNRVSLGVQSFVDRETRAVGRLHTRTTTLDDISRLRSAGIENLNLDLIAGLPHQTLESWQVSLAEVVSSGVPHASVYMLEVDEDSRLGRELMAGGTRYHAHFVPDDDLIADLYSLACETLEGAHLAQYEISNFARAGFESRHNLKYWTRQPYLGFGVDAHSMLPALSRRSVDSVLTLDPTPQSECGEDLPGIMAVRFATPDSLEAYLAETAGSKSLVSPQAALEESFFLGLRLNRGINLGAIRAEFGEQVVSEFSAILAEQIQAGLLHVEDGVLRLTPRGRLLSNEVFGHFVNTLEGTAGRS